MKKKKEKTNQKLNFFLYFLTNNVFFFFLQNFDLKKNVQKSYDLTIMIKYCNEILKR